VPGVTASAPSAASAWADLYQRLRAGDTAAVTGECVFVAPQRRVDPAGADGLRRHLSILPRERMAGGERLQ